MLFGLVVWVCFAPVGYYVGERFAARLERKRAEPFSNFDYAMFGGLGMIPMVGAAFAALLMMEETK